MCWRGRSRQSVVVVRVVVVARRPPPSSSSVVKTAHLLVVLVEPLPPGAKCLAVSNRAIWKFMKDFILLFNWLGQIVSLFPLICTLFMPLGCDACESTGCVLRWFNVKFLTWWFIQEISLISVSAFCYSKNSPQRTLCWDDKLCTIFPMLKNLSCKDTFLLKWSLATGSTVSFYVKVIFFTSWWLASPVGWAV